MTQLWFFPLAALVGVLGTQTSLRSLRGKRRDPSWWLLLVLGWLPCVCWCLSQFVRQG